MIIAGVVVKCLLIVKCCINAGLLKLVKCWEECSETARPQTDGMAGEFSRPSHKINNWLDGVKTYPCSR